MDNEIFKELLIANLHKLMAEQQERQKSTGELLDDEGIRICTPHFEVEINEEHPAFGGTMKFHFDRFSNNKRQQERPTMKIEHFDSFKITTNDKFFFATFEKDRVFVNLAGQNHAAVNYSFELPMDKIDIVIELLTAVKENLRGDNKC